MTKVNSYQFLGLPGDADPDEAEHHRDALLDLLRSDTVPAELQQWADTQAALVQEVYETLDPAEATMGNGRRVTVWQRSGGNRTFMQMLSRPLVLASTGVVMGVAILSGMWWTGVIPGRSQTPAADTTTNPQDTFDPQTFLESHQSQIATWTQAAAEEPPDTDALFNLGEVSIVGEQWDQAIIWFQKLLAVDPDGVYAQHARLDIGVSYMNLSMLDEAQQTFAEVLIKDPNNAQAHYDLGFLQGYLLSPPDYESAIDNLNQAIQLAPGTDLADAASQNLEQIKGLATAN